jgi:hypothetical protein
MPALSQEARCRCDARETSVETAAILMAGSKLRLIDVTTSGRAPNNVTVSGSHVRHRWVASTRLFSVSRQRWSAQGLAQADCRAHAKPRGGSSPNSRLRDGSRQTDGRGSPPFRRAGRGPEAPNKGVTRDAHRRSWPPVLRVTSSAIQRPQAVRRFGRDRRVAVN